MKIFRLLRLLALLLIITADLYGASRRPLYVTPSEKYHLVQPGDTLYRISQKSGISVENLKLYNNLADDRIEVGQRIYYQPKDAAGRKFFQTQRAIPPDKQHKVKKGESLTSIANLYDLDLLDLLHYNQISSWELENGQIIYLAAGILPENQPSARPEKKSEKKGEKKKEEKPEKTTDKIDENFISPLQNFRISQHFNKENRHQGIDLAAPAGTPVYAVLDGTVIYAGTQKGYGNLIILEHSDRLMTVYAHNETNLVAAGEQVKQGDQVATVGNTGRSTGNHLHFEIRQEGVAVDPARYINCLSRR